MPSNPEAGQRQIDGWGTTDNYYVKRNFIVAVDSKLHYEFSLKFRTLSIASEHSNCAAYPAFRI
jgi:hypothetical protein